MGKGNGLQVSDGNFTRVHNRILEELAKIQLSGYETRIILALWRKTYGWRKKEESIPFKQFEKMTNLPTSEISRTLTKLKARNLVVENYKSNRRMYRFNKHFTTWKQLEKSTSGCRNLQEDLGKSTSRVVEIYNKKLPRQPKIEKHRDPKETSSKETILKETITLVFAYWQKTFDHSRAKLTRDRRAKIVSRLKEGYSLDDLKRTIDGCKNSSYHQGENDQGKVYDSIELLFRNGDKVESFWQYTKNSVTSDTKVQFSKACAELGKLAGKKRILKWLLILPENYHSRLSQFLDRAYRQGHSYSEAKDEWRKQKE